MLRKKLKTSAPEKLLPKIISLQEYFKESRKVSPNFLQKLVNDSIISGKFPDNLE